MKNTYFNKDLHVKDYAAILIRRKWVIVSFFVITVSLITWMNLKQTPIYRASSTIIVYVQNPDILAVKDIIKSGETNYFTHKAYIETQQEIIKSGRIAYQVLENLGLKDTEEFKKTKDLPLDILLRKLRVELIRDTRIIKISAEDKDSRQAARIANEFAKVYVNSNIALNMQASADAESWLRKEVEKQKAKVRNTEISLQEYRKRIQAEATYRSLAEMKREINLENLPNTLADREIFTQLKKEYLSQQALLVEYSKVYKNKHPKMAKLLENIAYLGSRIKSEAEIIKTDVKTEYDQAIEGELKLKSNLEEKKKESLGLKRKIIGYNALKRELETNERILEIVLNRLKETSISQQMRTNNVRIQNLAEAPRRPVKPKKLLNIMFAIILGVAGGAGLVLFREYTDITIENSEDITSLIQLPLLGSIPRIRLDGKNIRTKTDADRVVEKDSLCMASEAYRSIRTSLLSSLKDSDSPKSLVITSSVPKEGKTISAINLAIMMAHSGESVLLVDSDMKRPKVHNVFNMDNETGFSNYLSGEVNFEKIIRYSGIDNLSIVPAGNISHKSAELISSKNAKLFLKKANAMFSKIIFDTPPITLVTDAAVLSGLCDGVVLIAKANRTTKDLLNNSKELLRKVGANIAGVILNNVSFTRNRYYYGKY